MNIGIRQRGRGRSALTRAERSAEARRTRAHSHLQRVRGHTATVRPSRRSYAAAAAAAAVAGAAFGVSLANGGGDAATERLFVHGTVRMSAAEVARAAASAGDVGTPDALAERLADHAWIAGARALRLPTGALLVAVDETVPVAIAASGGTDGDYVIDADGVPFAPADAARDPGLLRIVVSDPLARNEPNAALAAAVALARRLPEHGLERPSEVAFAADGPRAGYALRLAGLAPQVLLGDEALDSKLRSLAEIVAAGLPGLDQAAELDLRFAGQAILRNEPSHEGTAQAAATRGRAAPST